MLATKRLAKAAASPFLGRSLTAAVLPREEHVLPREEHSNAPKTHEQTKKTKENPSTRHDPWSRLFDDVASEMPAYAKFKGKNASRRLAGNYFSSARMGGSRRPYSTRAEDEGEGEDEGDSSRFMPVDANEKTAGSSSSSDHPPSLDSDSPFPFSPQGSNDASSSTVSSSTWDNIFDDVGSQTSFLPTRRRLNTHPRDGANAPRRQAITATEINAFEDMFNMIFQAVEERSQQAANNPPTGPSSPEHSEGVGRSGQGGISELFSRMRRRVRPFSNAWSRDADEDFDRKAEQIELCVSDFDLLEWAQREVFAESKAYEAAARAAIEERKTSGFTGKGEPLPPLQPPPYPHILALLMRTFRDKYKDPHLALAMFDHARHLSISSYVFGCTTPAYNQLIETRWSCFRDLRGVLEALEEMKVNGIPPDARTRVLTEEVRREAGARKLWFDDDEVDFGQDMHMLERIERLVARRLPNEVGPPGRRASSPAAGRDAWKNPDMYEGGRGWDFGEWPEPSSQTRRGGLEMAH